MKMYILVKKDVSAGHAIVAVAHASLACYLKFKDSEEVKQWLSGPFYPTLIQENHGLQAGDELDSSNCPLTSHAKLI